MGDVKRGVGEMGEVGKVTREQWRVIWPCVMRQASRESVIPIIRHQLPAKIQLSPILHHPCFSVGLFQAQARHANFEA